MTDETDEECLTRLKAEAVETGGWLRFSRKLHMQEVRVLEAWLQGPDSAGRIARRGWLAGSWPE